MQRSYKWKFSVLLSVPLTITQFVNIQLMFQISVDCVYQFDEIEIQFYIFNFHLTTSLWVYHDDMAKVKNKELQDK